MGFFASFANPLAPFAVKGLEAGAQYAMLGLGFAKDKRLKAND
jgi:hypothetical protein